MTSWSLDIVALENRQSGMTLEHYSGTRVEAFSTFSAYANQCNRQWRRIPLTSGHCVYQNVGTGYLLSHYVGEPMQARDRDAYNIHCQWLELDVDVSGFVALKNCATGMVLNHYRELSVQADSDCESGWRSQHWQLVTVRPTQRYEQQDGAIVALGEHDKYDIVALKNRETGKVIDHYAGERVEAYTSVVASESRQWYRIPMDNNNYAYKNVRTGKVLEHCSGESVQALTMITHLASHQWHEVDVGDGFVTLQNRRSGKKLHHCHETPTQACDHNGVYYDPKFHWELVWVRRHEMPSLMDDNRMSPWAIWWSSNVRNLTRSDFEEPAFVPHPGSQE